MAIVVGALHPVACPVEEDEQHRIAPDTWVPISTRTARPSMDLRKSMDLGERQAFSTLESGYMFGTGKKLGTQHRRASVSVKNRVHGPLSLFPPPP